MRSLVASLALAIVVQFAPSDVTCRVGTWSGSPADLAAIEAIYQQEQAARDDRAYATGAPERSPWSVLVRCTAGD